MIISAFPGTGKTWFHQNVDLSQYVGVLDSDSSLFAKDDSWPNSYIEHIRYFYKTHIVFCSSHKDVRLGLQKAGLFFTLVYPDSSLKSEYLTRYKERGSSQSFIDLLDANWDNWLSDCRGQQGCRHIVLQSGQFIKDVI